MASACSRFIRRTALPSLKSAVKSNVRTPSLGLSETAPASRVRLSSRPNCTAPSHRFSLFNSGTWMRAISVASPQRRCRCEAYIMSQHELEELPRSLTGARSIRPKVTL